MRVLSAAPLISKFRNRQFARKRVRHSSIISTLSAMGRGRERGPGSSGLLGGYVGPRKRVLKGRRARLPTSRASVSDRKDE
jgi:hypothetical protein